MSRSINRHRMANRYRRGLDALVGDDATTYTNAIAMLAQGAGEIAKNEQAKKAAAEASKEGDAARKAATDARKAAVMAAADAKTEKDTTPPGPKHLLATQLSLQADAAEAKAAYYGVLSPGGGQPGGGGKEKKGGEESITNKWWFVPLLAVGIGGAGLVTYKLIKK